ncbi:hypothetical protein MMC26_007684 [Xylographa opegraphella]|nr:hypothetical protein [Xylographa opegraphella]
MSTPFSTLASKPPQPPSLTNTSPNTSTTSTTTPLSSRPAPLRSPSSNNYASALASAQARSPSTPTPNNAAGSADGKVVGTGELGESFRPGIDRMQSWSEQDMKRAMQERLLSPWGEGVGEGREMGFSSRQGGGEGD